MINADEDETAAASSALSVRPSYCRGDMGDEMDFMEWAATVEMLADAEKRLSLLNATP